MRARVLWSALLGLLAWLPIGRASTAPVDAQHGERALFAISTLHAAVDPLSRAGEVQDLPRQLGLARRAPAWHGVPTTPVAARWTPMARAMAWHFSSPSIGSSWRGFREPRLIFPHDAAAPPAIS